MTIGRIDAFSGASGDMLLGAVVDLGVDVAVLRETLAGLDLSGWSLDAEPVTRGGIGATHVSVRVPDDGVVRTWANVRELLREATLPEPVRARSLATFERLARAEATVHRRPLEHVHFHEVGAVDAIVDVVGVCAGLHTAGVRRLTCAGVAVGRGMVRSEHGLLPVPAPAVVGLLADVGAPTWSGGIDAELCTPTGAALLAEWVDHWGDPPAMVATAVGYGAGSRDHDAQPNVVRLVAGEEVAGPTAAATIAEQGDEAAPRRAVVLEATVDDLPGEVVPVVLDALRAAGADDAWARPVLMKKGRPGYDLVCLAAPEAAAACRQALFEQSTTLGTRTHLVDKHVLARRWDTVDVDGHPVRLKIGVLDDRVANVAVEFDDAAAVATATGLPVKEVMARARSAWERQETPTRPE